MFHNSLQSYEKSRAEQKILIFFMPRQSKFAIFDGKVTKKRAKKKTSEIVFFFRVQSKFVTK